MQGRPERAMALRDSLSADGYCSQGDCLLKTNKGGNKRVDDSLNGERFSFVPLRRSLQFYHAIVGCSTDLESVYRDCVSSSLSLCWFLFAVDW